MLSETLSPTLPARADHSALEAIEAEASARLRLQSDIAARADQPLTLEGAIAAWEAADAAAEPLGKAHDAAQGRSFAARKIAEAALALIPTPPTLIVPNNSNVVGLLMKDGSVTALGQPVTLTSVEQIEAHTANIKAPHLRAHMLSALAEWNAAKEAAEADWNAAAEAEDAADEAWQEAHEAASAAADRILDVPVSTPAAARAKALAFMATFQAGVDEQGNLVGRQLPEEDVQAALATLLHDLEQLPATPSTGGRCLANELLIEADQIVGIPERDIEGADWDRFHAVRMAVANVQATSLEGAVFQIAEAFSAADLAESMEVGANSAPLYEECFGQIDRCLTSALTYFTGGKFSPAMSYLASAAPHRAASLRAA